MPCNTDYMREPPVSSEQHQRILADRDRLTAENDRLREIVIASVVRFRPIATARKGEIFEGDPPLPEDEPVYIDAGLYAEITGTQVEHRKHDLARCDRTLIAALRSFEPVAYKTGKALLNGRQYLRDDLLAMLGAVRIASPEQPLKPQLGFDPDDI